MNFSVRTLALFLALALNSGIALAAFDFSPIIATLSPMGKQASASFTVSNDSDRKTPVQVYIVHRRPDINGVEEYKETPDIDDQFQVYPSQLVLNPKERRTVRVSWIGDPKPKTELAYRIVAEELPFSVDDPKAVYKKPVAEITISSRYIGSLYVTPAGARPGVIAEGAPSEDKPAKLALTFQNNGGLHQVLEGIKIKVSSVEKKTEVEIPKDQLAPLRNQNILAGKTRKYSLPWPPSLPVGPVKVTLEFPKE